MAWHAAEEPLVEICLPRWELVQVHAQTYTLSVAHGMT
jgi:hypothetical protein